MYVQHAIVDDGARFDLPPASISSVAPASMRVTLIGVGAREMQVPAPEISTLPAPLLFWSAIPSEIVRLSRCQARGVRVLLPWMKMPAPRPAPSPARSPPSPPATLPPDSEPPPTVRRPLDEDGAAGTETAAARRRVAAGIEAAASRRRIQPRRCDFRHRRRRSRRYRQCCSGTLWCQPIRCRRRRRSRRCRPGSGQRSSCYGR